MGKMNPRVKELWVKALRRQNKGKKYRQGRHYLRQKTRDGSFVHCCLGVLSDLHRKEHKSRWRIRARGDNVQYYHGECYHLPIEVQRWAGLNTDPSVLDRLMQMNDVSNAEFTVIAEWVDENL